MKSERQLVYGMRPVLELLERRRAEVERILVARERRAGVGHLLRLAREGGVPVSHLERQALASQAGARALHQGIAAVVAPLAYEDPDRVSARCAPGRGLLVLVDRVMDPRNLGAILRTCAGAAVDGVLLAGGGGVGLTPVVLKAAAGAADRVPVAREPHPASRLERLRAEGFVALALDPRGGSEWHRADLRGPTVLVAGSEGRGIRPGILRACDGRLAIRLAPGLGSLNVAVALGVVLFEAVRQRGAGP